MITALGDAIDPELVERTRIYESQIPGSMGLTMAVWCPFCLGRPDGGKRLVIFSVRHSGGAMHEKGTECAEWRAHETAFSFMSAVRDRMRATVHA